MDRINNKHTDRRERNSASAVFARVATPAPHGRGRGVLLFPGYQTKGRVMRLTVLVVLLVSVLAAGGCELVPVAQQTRDEVIRAAAVNAELIAAVKGLDESVKELEAQNTELAKETAEAVDKVADVVRDAKTTTAQVLTAVESVAEAIEAAPDDVASQIEASVKAVSSASPLLGPQAAAAGGSLSALVLAGIGVWRGLKRSDSEWEHGKREGLAQGRAEGRAESLDVSSHAGQAKPAT